MLSYWERSYRKQKKKNYTVLKINYQQTSISKIDGFIQSYRIVFLQLFQGSWLIAEEEIIKNYINISRILRKDIFDHIESIASQKNVLGRSITADKRLFFQCTINSFRIFVYYHDDWNIRYIDDVDIFRK